MKLKRIFALIGAILLAGLFILAIILAVIGAPMNYLMAVIFSMMFASIIFYAMGLMTRVLKPSDPFEKENGTEAGRNGQDRQEADSCRHSDPAPLHKAVPPEQKHHKD